MSRWWKVLWKNEENNQNKEKKQRVKPGTIKLFARDYNKPMAHIKRGNGICIFPNFSYYHL